MVGGWLAPGCVVEAGPVDPRILTRRVVARPLITIPWSSSRQKHCLPRGRRCPWRVPAGHSCKLSHNMFLTIFAHWGKKGIKYFFHDHDTQLLGDYRQGSAAERRGGGGCRCRPASAVFIGLAGTDYSVYIIMSCVSNAHII